MAIPLVSAVLRTRTALAAGVVATVLAATPVAAAQPRPDASGSCGTHEAVHRSVRRLVAQDRIAGASVLVTEPSARPGCARWSVTDGVADLGTGRPMNTMDRLRVGSVTKTLALAVRDLRDAADGRTVSPTPWLADTLRFMLTGHDSAYGSAQTAILCADGTAPRDPETYWRDLRRAGTRDRLMVPVTDNINPCAFWDAPRERPTTIRADLPALLVNATGDPRTVYPGAEAVHRNWPSSRLVTLRDADQHAVFGVFGSSCVDDAVNAYLAGGRTPATDLTCPRP
ncbi:alpha/beta hydrolase [Streptomyces misionensis]|uniref:alpha/beta hydrolase n=1 Tax=Streptomyces misionensis TaxID=67331 RepID=UPI0033C0D2F0